MAIALDGLLIGVVFSLFGLGLFVAGVRRFFWGLSLYHNDARAVREIPQTEGAVEFDGQALPPGDGDSFEAPFSGEEAVLCQIWMEKMSRFSEDGEAEIYFDEDHRSPADTEKRWGLVESDEIRQPFAVADGGARVVVDPEEANLDITGHMGEVVHGTEEGESLSEEVTERLEAFDGRANDFDSSLETWDDEESAVKYREARLEPQDTIHVTGAAVQSIPEEWGSAVDATVANSEADDRYMISRGTESEVVRRHFIQFVTGTIVGLGFLGVGGRALYLAVLA